MRLISWLTAHDVKAIVSHCPLAAHDPPYNANVMPFSARSIYRPRKRRSSRTNTRGQHHATHVFGEEILIPSLELRYRCRASSIPSACDTRVITNTNGRLGRGKLRAHHRGSPARFPPITARIRRAIITTSALCRKHQQGRSPRGTPQPGRFYHAHVMKRHNFLSCIILDVVVFPSCICQRASSPFLARFQSTLRYPMTSSLDFTGLDPFDGILAPPCVERPPGRGSK